MTDNDYKDKFLEDFFAANRHDVADDGFTRRVMRRLPQRHNRLAQAWNTLCILLAAVLFVAAGGVQLVWATLQECFSWPTGRLPRWLNMHTLLYYITT